MYDLNEFDACYLDYKSVLDSDKQKYLNMLIELRNYNCSRYYELFVRGTIIQGNLYQYISRSGVEMAIMSNSNGRPNFQ